MNAKERIQAASNFILQSPPGQINDVLNDVRNIISDDIQLQEGVLPALREYNLAQFMTVDVPGTDHQSIISEAARAPSAGDMQGEPEQERFLDPRSQTMFAFDHLSLEATDHQNVEPDVETEPFRLALETATLAYLAQHFHDGVASVFSTPGSPRRFVIQVVANKYNPKNYWSGRWRSEYVVDLAGEEVSGKVLLNVHYYEQGNVQLSTTHDTRFQLTPAILNASPNSSAVMILARINEEEGEYQLSLGHTYQAMGEKTFKGLRRALPMTRQKLDWDKVLGYKLGAELAQSKTAFGNS